MGGTRHGTALRTTVRGEHVVTQPEPQHPSPPSSGPATPGGPPGGAPRGAPGGAPGSLPGYQPPPHGYAGTPPGALTPSDERLWSLLAHLSWVAGSVVGIAPLGPLGPLVVWLVLRDRSAMVRHHALEALNLWITVYLVGLVCIATSWLFLPLLLLGLVAVAATVLSVVAAIAAHHGEPYRYPLVLRLVR